MGWCVLRLSAKVLALLRLSVNFFQLRLKRVSFVLKSYMKIVINLYLKFLGSSPDEISYSFNKF